MGNFPPRPIMPGGPKALGEAFARHRSAPPLAEVALAERDGEELTD
jgi:hypothetical protein